MERTVSAVISWDKRKRECRLEKDKCVCCSQGLLQTCFRGFRNYIFFNHNIHSQPFFLGLNGEQTWPNIKFSTGHLTTAKTREGQVENSGWTPLVKSPH